MIKMAFTHLCWAAKKKKCYFIFFLTIPEFLQAKLCGCGFLIMEINKLSLKCRRGSGQALFLSSSLQGHEFNKVAEHSVLKPRRNEPCWGSKWRGPIACWERGGMLLGCVSSEAWENTFQKLWETIADRKGSTKTALQSLAFVVLLRKCCVKEEYLIHISTFE